MPINLEQVKEVAQKAFEKGAYKRLKGRERVAVAVLETPVKGGTDVQIGYKKYKVEKDAYLVFVDLMHNANFQHPVLYELHNLQNGTVRTIEEKFPLADAKLEQSLKYFILPKKEGK